MIICGCYHIGSYHFSISECGDFYQVIEACKEINVLLKIVNLVINK